MDREKLRQQHVVANRKTETLSHGASVFLAFIICCFLSSCQEKYSFDDYVGVYYNKDLNKKYKILDYVALKEDNTYWHKYIENGDTIIHEGTWEWFEFEEKTDITLKDWHIIGHERENFWWWDEDIETIDLSGLYSAYSWGFHPDDLDAFWRISSQEAAEIGINEENVTWYIETSDVYLKREYGDYLLLRKIALFLNNPAYYYAKAAIFIIETIIELFRILWF